MHYRLFRLLAPSAGSRRFQKVRVFPRANLRYALGMEQPATEFEWAIYADATFAGLSILIPLPLVDLAFEQYFRRRMPRSIARHRNRRLHPVVLGILNRLGCSTLGCLLFVPWLGFQLLKRLSRKILYFLTVKEATDTLAYYWHRAFLIDYALRSGHLDDATSALHAERAMDVTLDNAQTSPLLVAARQVVQQSPRVMSTLWRAVRRQREDTLAEGERATLRAAWKNLDHYLQTLAGEYLSAYTEMVAAEDAAPDPQ